MEDVRQFSGIMDADSDLRLVKNGNYRRLYSGCNGVTVNRGVVTNVPSNLKVANQLPAGTNKNIGALEDLAGSSIIYYNYNDTGKHGIYRWFRNKQGFLNGLIEKIYEVKDPSVYTPFNENPLDFSPNSEHRITGSYLIDNFLFFTDKHSRSKFIDVVRANETNKKRKFNVYFNRNTFGIAQTYTLNIWDGISGGSLGTLSWTTSASTYEQQTTDFVNAYRATSLGNVATIEDLNKFSTLTMNSVGEFYIQITSTATIQPSVVPENFYPDKNPLVPSYSPFSRDLIDRLCYTPQCDPQVEYKTDNTKATNFVQNKVFQARVRYQYFDNSWSVYSAISIIPIQSSDGSIATANILDNYIEIDFTDPRLEDAGLASIVKKVEIAVLQPVLGEQWITVTALDPYQFVGVGQQKYNFYNTETSIAIPVSDTVKPYDSLFIKHKSDEFVDDRGFPADGLEGYDKVPLDAQVRVEYEAEQTSDTTLYTIKGYIEIRNAWDGTGCAQYQPIYKIDNGVTVWGGFAGASGTPFLIDTKDANAHGQTMPLDGFTVYLAGTPHYATTVQQLPSIAGLTSDPVTGVLLLQSTPLSGAQWAALNNLKTQTIRHNFTISGVLAGKYVLRVASHQITASDLNSSTLDYQKTSTNTAQITGGTLPQPRNPFERVIEVTANVTGVQIVVLDMAADDNSSVTGYLCDNDNPSLVGTNILNDTRIHKAVIEWDYDGAHTPLLTNVTPISDICQIFSNNKTPTDHNGYYFFGVKGVGAATVTVNNIDVGVFTAATVSYFLADGTTAYTGAIPNQTGASTIFRNTDATVTDYAKTYVQGTIVDSVTALPIPNFSLVLGGSLIMQSIIAGGTPYAVSIGSGFAITDINGNFSIPLYSYGAGLIGSGQGRLFFNNSYGSNTYSINQALNPNVINISVASTDYYKANPYILGSLSTTVTLLLTAISKSFWKRGSDRFFGIVYGDEGDRKTAVCTMNDPTHITFYTEKDANGVIHPTGAANIIVDVNNEPPEWATKYYIVAMKNQQHEDHLQWLANTVIYTDSAGNTVSYLSTNAVFCKINLENIGYYTTNQHPNSIIAYTFQAGDRIRFMKNESGTYYTKYLDYEILSATATDIIIVYDPTVQFKAGCSFELYSPKTTDQTKIFYEIGHCGEVKSAIINGELKKYHVGTIQDQTYAPLGAGGEQSSGVWILGGGWTYSAGVLTSGVTIGTTAYEQMPNIISGRTYRVKMSVIAGVATVSLWGGTPVEISLDQQEVDIVAGVVPNIFEVANIGGAFSASNISVSLSTFAIVQLDWGDVYYRWRSIYFNTATTPVLRSLVVSDDSISDFFSSRAIGWGRPNTDAITQGQIDRQSTIRFSNRYISGTLINGLRNFEALNEKQFSTSYGELLKLQLVDKTVLKAIFSNSFMVSMYINQGVLRTANGSTLVSISNDVIAQTHEMQRNFGSLNAESIVLNDEADLFGWDENVGVVWRSSGNGLIAVSEQLMITAFNDIQKKRVDLGRNNSEVVAVYDNNTDMLIMSFRPIVPKAERKSRVVVDLPDFYSGANGNLSVTLKPLNILFGNSIFHIDPDFPDIALIIQKIINNYGNGWSAFIDAYGDCVIESPDGSSLYYNQSLIVTVNQTDYSFVFTNGSVAGTGTPYAGETLAYCKGKNGWTEYYPFVPEGYGRLRQDYVSFLNGEMWLHGDTSQYNNFYGVQYSRTLTVPFNLGFEKVKTYKYIEANTDEPCYCPKITIPRNDQNQVGMETEITAPAFKVVLGKYWSKIPRDKLTPWMQPNQQQAWVNGRPMRGQVLVAEISTDSTNLAALIETKVDSFFEERS